MTLRKVGAIFVLDSAFADKQTVKAAGFWWHAGQKCTRSRCAECASGLGATWWTAKPDIAVQFLAVADDEARAALGTAAETLTASRAEDSEIEIPANPGCVFKPYQKAGVAYALQRRVTLIADDMGLGKTIQALGVANAVPEVKTILVICKASLKINWYREARKWLTRPYDFCVIDRAMEVPPWASFVIVNYDRLLSEPVRDSIIRRSWDLVIVDEMQKCKNTKAKRTKAVFGYGCEDCKGSGRTNEMREAGFNEATGERVMAPVRGKYVVCATCEGRGLETSGVMQKASLFLGLTGTPIMNRPGELFPFLHAAYPEEFPSWYAFRSRFCAGMDDGASNLDQLQARLRGLCMVRRLKKDVLKDLPPKTRSIVMLDKADFDSVLEAEANALANVADAQEALDAMSAAKEAEGEAGKDSESYQIAVAKLKTIRIPFEEISRVRHLTALAKVPAVLEYLDEILENVDKVVVFAHHRDVLAGIAAPYKSAAVLCDGDTKIVDRQKYVDRFQIDPSCKVMVASISAMGEGWTMTAATHVVFAELDWTPAGVTQAEDRLHRIGQLGNVTVHHLVIDESIDAKMAKTIVSKQEIADQALDRETTLVVNPAVTLSEAVLRNAISDEQTAAIRSGLFERFQTGGAASTGGSVVYDNTETFDRAHREAAHKAMKFLAGHDVDRAGSRNGEGFSKYDSEFGHKLADAPGLSHKQTKWAVKLATKYRRQLYGTGLLDALGIPTETPKRKREKVAA